MTLNKQIVSAQAANAALSAKTAELNASIQPRGLTEDEIRRVIGAVVPFRGRSVAVQWYIGDAEGHRLLYVLAQVLGKAGLKVDVGYWYPDASSQMQYLLGLEVSAPPADSDLAQALKDALASTHLGARTQWYPVPTEKQATIHIGVKPFEVPQLRVPPRS